MDNPPSFLANVCKFPTFLGRYPYELFLDPKDLSNWLCHSVTPSLRHSVRDVFETENHCLVLDNFKIQPQLYSMVKYSWLDLIIMVGFNNSEGMKQRFSVLKMTLTYRAGASDPFGLKIK